jgi:DNA invertase Pin-like site-specific DNA recombinase
MKTSILRHRYVVRYLRVSTEHQDLERQDAPTAQVAERLWPGVETIDIEEKASAFTKRMHERKEGMKLLAMIQAGEVLAVVADEQSRFERGGSLEFGLFMRLCRENDVAVATVANGLIEDTPEADLIAGVLAYTDTMESLNKSHRLRSRFKVMAEKGLWVNGSPPWGYKRSPEGVLLPTPQLAHVKKVFERYADGETLGSLAEWLSQHRPNTIRQFVRDVLRNPAYRGIIAHDGQEYPSRHEALIGPDLWQRVESRLNRNVEKRSTRPARVQPFTELLVCECGRSMAYHRTAKPGQGDYAVFVCRYGCNKRVVSEFLEVSVLLGLSSIASALHDRLNDPTWRVAYPSDDEIKRLGGVIAEYRESETRLVAMAERGVEVAVERVAKIQMDRHAAEELLKRLVSGGDDYRRRLEALREALLEVEGPWWVEDMGPLWFYVGAWVTMDLDARRRLLNRTLERIEVGQRIRLVFHAGIEMPVPLIKDNRHSKVSKQLRGVGLGLTSASPW